MHIPLMLDGTNFSAMKMDTSSTREDKYLQSKASLTIRTDKLSERIRMMKTTRNGTFSMLMLLNLNQPKVSVRPGVCISIDLSILFRQ